MAIIVNQLELFSPIFGAKFVFKLLPNFAFKNNSPELGFWVKIDFNFIIQNLSRIQSCRELNSKQLSFLVHFQKMSFSCLKWYLKAGIWKFL